VTTKLFELHQFLTDKTLAPFGHAVPEQAVKQFEVTLQRPGEDDREAVALLTKILAALGVLLLLSLVFARGFFPPLATVAVLAGACLLFRRVRRDKALAMPAVLTAYDTGFWLSWHGLFIPYQRLYSLKVRARPGKGESRAHIRLFCFFSDDELNTLRREDRYLMIENLVYRKNILQFSLPGYDGDFDMRLARVARGLAKLAQDDARLNGYKPASVLIDG